MQLEALKLVREFRRALVYSRRPEAALGYARDVSRLGIEVVPAGSLSELVRESDVVITATPAREALVRAEDVHPGLHVTAMGSDGPGKQELDPGVLGRADRIVCDSKDQCRRLGELQHARLGDDARVFELGQVAAGIAPGRESDREITVCDLTGLGVQDTAIANFVYERAIARGLGTTVNL
jgi:ornithine cyclodeaminase